MKQRKQILSVFLIMTIVFLFCGCGDRSAEDDVTHISIWHVYGAQTDSPLNDLVEEFNNTVGKEEGIRVEVTMVSNNKNIHNHILAAANNEPGAAELPDIFVAYPNTVLAMPDSNILVDYRDYFSEKELSAFIPAFLDDGMVNDRLVVLPVAKSTELMFINKTAFDRFAKDSGAALEDLNTWEGLYQTAIDYAQWTDAKTPDVQGDAKALFVHDFHFNYFQVGTESLGESFFEKGKPAFGPQFEYAWGPYAEAALKGGVWLQGGYATEPLRTGETIVSVASSASVLYFSTQVTYADNTTEEVELIVRPCPVFENGENLVMQRGAGMCVVRSDETREEAAMTFLKWLTEPEVNTRFAVSTGYMPVTQAAFDDYLPEAIDTLTEQKYVELYRAFIDTYENYEFYIVPQFEGYLQLEENFEAKIREQLSLGRESYLSGGFVESLIKKQLGAFQSTIGK